MHKNHRRKIVRDRTRNRSRMGGWRADFKRDSVRSERRRPIDDIDGEPRDLRYANPDPWAYD